MKAVEMDNRVEALLFASGEPVSIEKIAECSELKVAQVERSIERLEERYKETALHILQVGKGKYQISTRAEQASFIKKLLLQKKDAPLSQAALEVLSIVAYNEPVTRNFVEQIRGVDSSGVINTLIQKKLLEEAGRMDLPGRPIAYKTTPGFLRCFSLSDRDELPVIDDLIEQFSAQEQTTPIESAEGGLYQQGEIS